jgi:hypothetical protein
MTFTMGRLFVVAFVAALAALFLSSVFNQAQSQDTGKRGPFMISAGFDRMVVWRVDQATGAVSYCMRDSVSTDRRYIATHGAFCSAWSD